MSAQTPQKRFSIRDVRDRKGTTPLVCLTAYTTPMARIVDPHVDLVLVGDSLGMVLYGMETTLGVTLDMMIAHGKAVMRGSNRACVVVDMPFASYQESREQAFRSCARVMAETGCAAVKLEGGQEMAETVCFLVDRGIPVMGHIGLCPQSVKAAGGFRVHGRDELEARRLVADAKALDEAGAFSIVLEGVVAGLGAAVTGSVSVPVIAIGASADCDGQILVTDDMLGLFTDFKPTFVKRYAELAQTADEAVSAYAAEVRARLFPAPEHHFAAKPVLRPNAGRKAKGSPVHEQSRP